MSKSSDDVDLLGVVMSSLARLMDGSLYYVSHPRSSESYLFFSYFLKAFHGDSSFMISSRCCKI